MVKPTENIGFSIQLETDMESAQARLTEALKAEGFGILTEIDVQATFKKKINQDFRPYKILGACNPHLAYRALSQTGEVGLLLPCNVTVTEIEPGQVEVAFIDPLAMMSVISNPELVVIAQEARDRLERASKNL